MLGTIKNKRIVLLCFLFDSTKKFVKSRKEGYILIKIVYVSTMR